MGFWSRAKKGFPLAIGSEPLDSVNEPVGSASNPITYGQQENLVAPLYWKNPHDSTAMVQSNSTSFLTNSGPPVAMRIPRLFRPNYKTYFAGSRQFGWLQTDANKYLPPMSGPNRSVQVAAVKQPPTPTADRAFVPGVYVPFGGQ